MKLKKYRRFTPKNILVVGLLLVVTFFSFKQANDYFEISKNMEIFNSIYKEVNMIYVDEAKPGELMTTGINAMLKSLDPYTVYYPESRIEDARVQNSGQAGNVGIVTKTEKEQYYVGEVFEGLPADKSGIKAGDKLISIDDNEVEGLREDEIDALLKGPVGSVIKVLVDRKGTGEMTFEVEREDVEAASVPFYGMIDDKIGYVKLARFSRSAGMEVRKAIKDLKDRQGMERLIFDLRDNGGGLLREAVNIVNLFVPKGTLIVKTKGKIESWNKTHVGLADPLVPDMPVIVLVNGSSASASEVVSGGLQDLDRAVVIGSQSFGKGLVQQTKDVAFNSKMKLTVAKYYCPSGRCIQKLDYSNKIDGKAKAVKAENISPFKTANGRTVYDGQGIAPDVDISQEESSNLIKGLNSNNLIFHFATNYVLKRDSIDDAENFRLTDADYLDFVKFVEVAQVMYNTETETKMEELLASASDENYSSDIKADMINLFEKIKPNANQDLMNYKDLVKGMLEAEIVSRYFYENGKIRNELKIDPYILRSKNVFANEYNKILQGPN